MRVLTMAMLAVGAVSIAQPAQAQTYDPSYPVCMRVFGDPTYFDCRYSTIAQCKGTAAGRGAECLPNPYFASAVDPARRRHRAY
ncbi:Protein of unknown function [Bradyrhizobium erythrophlei]|jgi:hypothetical protein|nr:Protein of unknown function [Bradyrhizobium erythrophlei]